MGAATLPLFLAFLAFVATFVITRVITRLIRSGKGPFKDNVSSSGVHVHHAVPGILALVAGAFLALGADGASPAAEIAGLLVGAGTALVLDEFALILHLDDVYWKEEGRISVEMVALVFACVGMVVVGANPFRIDRSDGAVTIVASIVVMVFHFAFVLLAVMKGKYPTALFGIFIPTMAICGAIRLARPGSRWARKRYDDAKLARATERAHHFDQRYKPFLMRIGDAVAGSPAVPEPATTPGRAADAEA